MTTRFARFLLVRYNRFWPYFGLCYACINNLELTVIIYQILSTSNKLFDSILSEKVTMLQFSLYFNSFNLIENVFMSFVKNAPKIATGVKLQSNSVVPKLFWNPYHLKYFSAPRSTKHWFWWGLTDHLSSFRGPPVVRRAVFGNHWSNYYIVKLWFIAHSNVDSFEMKSKYCHFKLMDYSNKTWPSPHWRITY